MVWVGLLHVWKHLVVWRLWIVLGMAAEVTWSLWIVSCILDLGLLKVVWWIRAEDLESLEMIGEGIWKFLSHLEWFPLTRIVLKGLSLTQVFLELSWSRVLGPNVVTL